MPNSFDFSDERRQPGLQAMVATLAMENLNAVWQRNVENQQIMAQGLQSGTPEGRQAAANAYATIAADFIQNGINPKPLQAQFEFMSKQTDSAGQRRVDPAAPN
jgi:hypothetical protein